MREMKWLFFPPVFSFILLIITAVLHDRSAEAYIPPTVWGMTIAAYICMCALSLFNIVRGETKYNAGIAALSQGMLLSVLSMQFGVTYLSWLGLILFLAGLVMAFFYSTRNSADSFAAAPIVQAGEGSGPFKRFDDLLDKFSIPVCYTDSKGIIASATDAFCDAVGRPPEAVAGKVISDIIPMDSDEAAFESGKWHIAQEKDGARFYFYLSPIREAAAAQAAPEAPGGVALFDKATGLYTDEYRKIRGPEEVSRAQRYKRPLSGLLVALDFEPATDVKLTTEQTAMLDNAFKTRIQKALRTTDCGFLTSEGRIQILLPETPQAGAKTLLARIVTLPQDVFDEDIRNAVNPKVKGGMFFYNGASRMEYGIFSAALEEAFIRSGENKGDAAPASQAA
jgi:PAS domain-containing protein